MKLKDITEQLQKRKSPEELAAMKAAPDYWKKETRKEFNDVIKKFGATSRENNNRPQSDSSIRFDREIVVPQSPPNSMMLGRDKRGKALILAIAKWLVKQKEMGRKVSIPFWGMQHDEHTGTLYPEDPLEKALQLVNDITRIDSTIEWLHSLGERGEKMPLKLNLPFTIELQKSE